MINQNSFWMLFVSLLKLFKGTVEAGFILRNVGVVSSGSYLISL